MKDRYGIVILGSGVAGSSALAELASRGVRDVLMLTADRDLPYDRPPLSKEFLRGTKQAEAIRYHDEAWYAANGVELVRDAVATGIDAAGHALILADLPAGGQAASRVEFGKLLLAPGVAARRLAIPGADGANVHYLRSLADSIAIKRQLKAGKRLVVIGGGFIGMEVAAAALEYGAAVTVVNLGGWLWDRFTDRKVSSFFEEEYRRRGARLIFEDEPTAFVGEGSAFAVHTKKGETLPCDAVVVGIGTVLPDALFAGSGLLYDKGLLVDERMRSSHADIYGAGDIVRFIDPIFGARRRVEHWGHADASGRLAARNVLGADESYGLLTYVFSDLFDLHLEFAGDETGYEAIETEGSFADREFTALYRKGGKVRAYFQINGSQEERDGLERRIREEAK